jgi:hypothetical protein
MLTSSFLMLAAASFIVCISCSRVFGFSIQAHFGFHAVPHKEVKQRYSHQVTEVAMAQVRLFLTIDQKNVH